MKHVLLIIAIVFQFIAAIILITESQFFWVFFSASGFAAISLVLREESSLLTSEVECLKFANKVFKRK